MFKDPRAAILHWGIFWGFILLTIGTANIVTGGIIQGVLSMPFGGLLWALVLGMQNVVAVIVIVSILWAFERRLISKPKRLTFNRDALLILAMIGGLVTAELLALVFEVARYGDQNGAFVANLLAIPLRGLAPSVLEVAFGLVVAPHRDRVGVPRLPAVQQAPPHRDELLQHLLPQAAAPRRAAEDGPRAGGRDLRGPHLG